MGSTLLLDLRSAIRGYLKQPGFTLAAVFMLALGIGANTALFSVAYGILLRPLSYPEPHRLVGLWPETTVNKLIAARMEAAGDAFTAVSAYTGRDFPLVGAGDPTIVPGAQVGTQHFGVLGAAPLLGRTFTAEESQPGNAHVAVIAHGLWERRFGGDPSVVGRSIDLDGVPHEVVGVMPADFQPLTRGWELWTPLPIDAGDPGDYFGSFYLQMVARLRPGVSLAQADARLQSLVAELRSEFPNLMTDEKVAGARAVPLHGHLVGRVGSTLLVLLGAVGVVLLIACGNVANLILGRASARRRETALRGALGAGPRRIAQYILVENLLLGLAGGAAGLLLAALTMRALLASLPADIPRASEISIDGYALAFALVVSVVAALLFGLAPLRQALWLDLYGAIKEEGGATSVGRRGRRSGQALVVAQIAAATVLLTGAGLLLKSLARLQSVDPGLRVEQLYTLRTDLVGARYASAADKIDFYRRAAEGIGSLPGVQEVGAIHLLPLTADNWSFPYVAEEQAVASAGGGMVTLPSADFRIVTPEYFSAAGIPLLTGRAFAATDGAEAAPVGVINRTMAEDLWPGRDPVGKTIQLFGDGGPVFTVVGVVGDVHEFRLDQPAKPAMYRPFVQWPNGSMYLMVRTSVNPATLAGSIHSAVAAVDPGVPVTQARPMSQVVRTSVSDDRFTARLIGAFAILALLLAASGAYSVISYAVARRAREMAIRVALGAQRRDVFWQVMREGLALTALGLLLGGVAAVAANRALASRLYEVSTVDPTAFVLAGVLIGATAVFSYWMPATRATRADPLLALRAE